jgi:hypothetical protein
MKEKEAKRLIQPELIRLKCTGDFTLTCPAWK